MRSFFKTFLASFLALIVFCLIVFFILVGVVTALTTKSKPDIASKSILELDLGQLYHERMVESPLSSFSSENDAPGVFDVIRLINHAKTDNDIVGIYVRADDNVNGFATSKELREAL